MRFCVVQFKGEWEPRLCRQEAGGLVPLEAPPSLRQALDNLGDEGLVNLAERATAETVPLERVERWLPPAPDPRTYRDFYAFEQHVKTARALRGQEMIPEWYQIPIFYFSNPTTLKGHLEPVRRPKATQELDYELEIAAVLGRPVQDVAGDEAEEAIFGYTILNDLSARDVQRQEMKCMLGPAKGKDFASALGPVVVTKDELSDVRVGPGKYNLVMAARRNGRELSRGNMNSLTYDFTQMLARASADAPLFPGDVIGSGTVGTGCILELTPEKAGGWLQPGDTIELEIDRIGVLTTPIV